MKLVFVTKETCIAVKTKYSNTNENLCKVECELIR